MMNPTPNQVRQFAEARPRLKAEDPELKDSDLRELAMKSTDADEVELALQRLTARTHTA